MYRLAHLGDVQFDVGIDLEEFVMGAVDFVLDVLLQIGHLDDEIVSPAVI